MPITGSDWKSGYFSNQSHVKITNKTDQVVSVFSFCYQDVAYISYSDCQQCLKPGHSTVLAAASNGAGKITIGVATGVVREAGGSAVDWAVAAATADAMEMAMMGQPRYKLRLRNVNDNTECSIILDDDELKPHIIGSGVTPCATFYETEIEGASTVGVGILRCLQETAMVVASAGTSIAAKNAAKHGAKMTAKMAIKSVAKEQVKFEVKKRLKKKLKKYTKKQLKDLLKQHMKGEEPTDADLRDIGWDGTD